MPVPVILLLQYIVTGGIAIGAQRKGGHTCMVGILKKVFSDYTSNRNMAPGKKCLDIFY